MPTKNIFAGCGSRATFVNLVYSKLMTREFLTYADVLASYYQRPNGYYNTYSCGKEEGYGELKKAFSFWPMCIGRNK